MKGSDDVVDLRTFLAGQQGGDEFLSKGGYKVRRNDDRWKLSKDVTINLRSVVIKLEPQSANGYRQALEHYAREHSAHLGFKNQVQHD